MVGQSDPPFRTLCLQHGATCVYTEMLYASLVAGSLSYFNSRLQDVDHTFAAAGMSSEMYKSRPLVVQLCGHEPDVLAVAAARIVDSGRADAIDYNLGCPQDRARDGLYGSFLLDKRHWDTVFRCVSSMVAAVGGRLPVTCKIRLCEDGVDIFNATEAFCRGLVGAGAAVICVHGRTRGSTKHRRAGPADLGMVGRLASAFVGVVPFVTNGNIVGRADVASALAAAAPCCGVMAAEGLLRDPALFQTSLPPPPDRLSLFLEYCSLSDAFFNAGGWAGLARTDAAFEANTNRTGTGTDATDLDALSLQPHGRMKQVDVARSHLQWMLEKRGHGRTVRFTHLGPYRKHVNLLNALRHSTTMIHLINIARECLVGVGESRLVDIES